MPAHLLSDWTQFIPEIFHIAFAAGLKPAIGVSVEEHFAGLRPVICTCRMPQSAVKNNGCTPGCEDGYGAFYHLIAISVRPLHLIFNWLPGMT